LALAGANRLIVVEVVEVTIVEGRTGAMKLCYRGVGYPYDSSSIEHVETEGNRMFLGKTYRLRQPIYQPKQQTLNLVYRGVAYSIGDDPASQPPLQPPQPSKFVAQLSAQLGLSS
jgi:hypothetical protein